MVLERLLGPERQLNNRQLKSTSPPNIHTEQKPSIATKPIQMTPMKSASVSTRSSRFPMSAEGGGKLKRRRVGLVSRPATTSSYYDRTSGAHDICRVRVTTTLFLDAYLRRLVKLLVLDSWSAQFPGSRLYDTTFSCFSLLRMSSVSLQLAMLGEF